MGFGLEGGRDAGGRRVGVGHWLGQCRDDPDSLDADMDDPAERRDEVARIVEPCVGIVDDAALFVPHDPVAVDEPFEGCSPVHQVSVRLGGNPRKAEMLVNDEDAFVGVREPHRSCADPIGFRLGLVRRHEYGVQRILRAGFITEMQLRQVAPSLGEGLEIRRKRNARQSLRQIVGEPFPVCGGMKDSVNVVDLPMTLIQASGRGAIGRVTVTVVDGVGVSGTQVQGGWSGVVSGGEIGTTNGSGVVVFDSPKASRHTTGPFIFTVTSLGAGGYNHDVGASVTSVCIERTTGSSTNWIPCAGGPVNTPPNVTISDPSDGSSFDTGTSVGFTGSASDAEDGDMTSSTSWSSDLQGDLGDGESINAALVDGEHTITATVTDSGGASDSAQVTVTIGAAPPPPEGALGNLSGNVRQGKTRYEFAVVTFTVGAKTYEDETDANGVYSFTGVPVGVHSVRVTIAAGSCEKTSNAEVFDGQTTMLNFRLKC